MDQYRIDSHKLHFHIPRLHEWLQGETVYPIYAELSPSGMCNHRCTFCALDFMGYRKKFLDTEMLQERLAEMGRLGVKSIMFGGEGEPLLHKDIARLVQTAYAGGIDTAFTTNGVLLDAARAERIIDLSQWVKVSLNAGTPQTYARIHQTRPADFGKVLDNLAYAASYRARVGSSCVLGAQILLLPENRGEISLLARQAKDTGLDYLVVKPYSHHPATVSERYKDIRYEDIEEICAEAQRFSDEKFRVIIRADTMQAWNHSARSYQRCLALPFWSYIDASGNVWGCSAHLGDERFRYGNIYDESFEQIWQGQRRRESLHWVEHELNAAECRINCRMDKINQYLWELQHPPDHVNFI